MSCLFKNLRSLNIIKIPVRYKNPPHHWSVLKKKKSSSQKALDHFNDFYASIYGNSWKMIRLSLLTKEHKYVAIVNSFSDTKRICQELECLGAISMKNFYSINKTSESQKEEVNKNGNTSLAKVNKILDCISNENEMEYSKYPHQYNQDLSELEIIENKNKDERFKPIELQSIEKNVTILSNNDRIIKSSFGLPASQLHEFIPATQIKGMDNYVLESEHYSFYDKGLDFPIQIEPENYLTFPDKLFIYTFESGNKSEFPKPKSSNTITDYFTVNSASVLPVLSLDLQPEDKVLDMCAGPGGKTLIALQTLIPNIVVANDIQQSRVERVRNFINQFIPNIEDWYQRFFLTMSDARFIEDKNLYNKILVDVPCTTDRHVLHENDNNIFKGSRIKERLKLPEVQSEILANALKIVTCGGTVVYSTCTLSPIQNDGVVQVALKKVFEENNIVFVVKDQSTALVPLRFLYTFGDFGLKYGHIVIPTKKKNCGPLYFCKMVRIK